MSHRLTALFFALVLVGCCVRDAHAQRVRLLAVGDTGDSAIGQSVDNDLGNMVSTFFILLRDGQLDFNRLSGDDVTTEKILKSIERIRVKPDDAIVFYWAGHGAFDADGHYLQMPKGGNLYRSTLLGALKRKQARLTVLLTDSCAVHHDVTAGMPQVSPASPDPNRATSPLFDELFFKTRGVVDVNAAEKGELALGTKDGGLFSLSLAYMMPGKKLTDGDPGMGGIDHAFGVFWSNSQKRLSWEAVIAKSRRKVQDLFQQLNPDGLIARDGKAYHKQTVAGWALPEKTAVQPQGNRGSRFGVEAVDNNGEGVRIVNVWPDYPGAKVTDVRSNRVFSLQRGDVLLSVNGRKLNSTKDYWDAVKSSPQTMRFTVRKAADGMHRNLQVQLRY